jgi:glycosyltransferase involved in cell wall biosynthesis
MLVDYDDAIFHHYDLAKNPYKRLLANKIDRVMQAASVVVCGNDYLAERAARAGAKSIVKIPTSVDLERYPVVPPEPSAACRIGWIGTPRTVHYLEALRPVLQRAAARVPLQLVVVGARFEAPGLDVVCRPWTEDSEAAEIRNFDIGIMPLPDEAWERGKCAYKLIQAMACARPVIGSRVGANCSVVRHGVNGYLAASDAQWQRAIETLAGDARLRQGLGLAGRCTVESVYSLQANAPAYAQVCLRAARRDCPEPDAGWHAGHSPWRQDESKDCHIE